MFPITRTRCRSATLAAAAVALCTAAAGCGSSADATTEPRSGPISTTASSTPPATGAPAAEIARVRGSGVGLYATPGAARPASTLSSPNAYGAVRVLLVTGHSGDWLRVLLPTRPNGAQAWVRSSAVTLTSTTWRLVIRLGALRFAVYDGNRTVRTGPIAVGTQDTPTPPGRYYLTELLRSPDPDGDYGPYAYGLSGHSPTLKHFGAGPAQLGVHGTNRPALLGHRVSHGCIRIRNADITYLARHLVLGTPVTVTK